MDRATNGGDAVEFPKIISVDDHIIEPPDLWTRLPKAMAELGPQCQREMGAFAHAGSSGFSQGTWVADPDLPGARWADVWRYEDMVLPLYRAMGNAGFTDEDPSLAITYDDLLPATYQRDARLKMMADNHTDVSICFPSIPRFCGQTFSERKDKDVALAALQVYNDWIIDEWCAVATSANDPVRLIPLTLIPLWDADLAAGEVHRCAAKGSHAIAFSESPPMLGLPSIYSNYWDPLFVACEETDTVINMHVGSSSKVTTTAPDQPMETLLLLLFMNSQMALTDWLYSGTLERFPKLRVSLPESHAGWIPFAVQRMDNTWLQANEKFQMKSMSRRATDLPSKALAGRVFACLFDDIEGLLNRDKVGIDQLLFETDFPHLDSTYPHSRATAEKICSAAGLNTEETYKLMRGNAITAFGLDQYFGIAT
jgi:predicted TIM-barrel fold metal-dependent hydrolase